MDFMFDLPEELSFLTKPSTPSPAKAEENNESDRYSPSRITPDDDNLDTEDNDSKQSISNNSLEHSADLGGFSLADEIISAAASGSFCPEAEEQLPPSSTSALTSELLPETNVEINALDGLAILESILSTTDVINTSKKLEVVESVEKNRFKPVFTQRSLDVESNKKSSILDDIEKQEISIVENVKNIELKTSESKPTESDKPSSRVLSLLPKLGKSEAKKRLLAFSGKTSFGLKAKAVKSSPFVEEENVLGGANLQSPSVNAVDDSEQLVKDEKKDLTKKKNKKTATLSNMEQIRSEETRLKEALGLKNVPFSSLENGVYHMAQFLDNPEALKKLERQSRHMEQKIEKYRQYTMRNALKDKPKDLEMEEKRHKPKRLPRSWKEFREEKFTYEMLHKMKLDRSHSRSRSRSRDRRSRSRSRSRERRGRSGSRDRHRGRGSPGRSHRRSPHMLFPIKARPGFNSTTRKEYPGQFIRFSKTRPKITYSINPNKFSRAYDNRIFVLRNAVREERHIMEKFLVLPNSCEMNSKKSFDQQSWFKPMQDWVNDKVDEAPVVSKWDSEENLDVQDTKTSTKAGKKDKEKKTEKLDTVKPELEVKVESESEKLNDKDDESLNLNSEYEAFMQMVSKDKDEVEVKLEKGKEFQIKNLPQASNKEDREKLKNNAKVDEMDKKNAKKLEKKKKKEEKKQKKQAKKEKKEKKKEIEKKKKYKGKDESSEDGSSSTANESENRKKTSSSSCSKESTKEKIIDKSPEYLLRDIKVEPKDSDDEKDEIVGDLEMQKMSKKNLNEHSVTSDDEYYHNYDENDKYTSNAVGSSSQGSKCNKSELIKESDIKVQPESPRTYISPTLLDEILATELPSPKSTSSKADEERKYELPQNIQPIPSLGESEPFPSIVSDILSLATNINSSDSMKASSSHLNKQKEQPEDRVDKSLKKNDKNVSSSMENKKDSSRSFRMGLSKPNSNTKLLKKAAIPLFEEEEVRMKPLKAFLLDEKEEASSYAYKSRKDKKRKERTPEYRDKSPEYDDKSPEYGDKSPEYDDKFAVSSSQSKNTLHESRGRFEYDEINSPDRFGSDVKNPKYNDDGSYKRSSDSSKSEERRESNEKYKSKTSHSPPSHHHSYSPERQEERFSKSPSYSPTRRAPWSPSNERSYKTYGKSQSPPRRYDTSPPRKYLQGSARSRSPKPSWSSPPRESHSPHRYSMMSRSPKRYSRSPPTRDSPHRYSRSSRSPSKRYSRSPPVRPRSPNAGYSRSPQRTRSPENRYSRSPCRRSKSPSRRYARSPERRSPRRRSRSPISRSRSPVRRSRSPVSRSRSPVRRSRSPVSRARSPGSRARSPGSRARSPVRRSRSPPNKRFRDHSPGYTARSPPHSPVQGRYRLPDRRSPMPKDASSYGSSERPYSCSSYSPTRHDSKQSLYHRSGKYSPIQKRFSPDSPRDEDRPVKAQSPDESTNKYKHSSYGKSKNEIESTLRNRNSQEKEKPLKIDADSTISDSELTGKSRPKDESRSSTSPVNSPPRLSLDERLEKEHGLDLSKEEEKYAAAPPVNEWEYYQASRVHQVKGSSQIIRVGNVLQILPQESVVYSPPKPIPTTNIQSGNVIQVVPSDNVALTGSSVEDSAEPQSTEVDSNNQFSMATLMTDLISKSKESEAAKPVNTTVQSNKEISSQTLELLANIDPSILEKQARLLVSNPDVTSAAAAAVAASLPFPLSHLITTLYQQNLITMEQQQQLMSATDALALDSSLNKFDDVDIRALEKKRAERAKADRRERREKKRKDREERRVARSIHMLEQRRSREEAETRESKEEEEEEEEDATEKLAEERNDEHLSDDEILYREAISEVPNMGSPIPDYELSPDEDDEEEESSKKKTLLPLPSAEKGILLSPNYRGRVDYQRKTVKFADGIAPGDGTSPSGGEEMYSPPPPVQDDDTLPKKAKTKKLRKKRKMKVKSIKLYTLDQDDEDSPPPPPPSSPPPTSAVKICPGYNYYTTNGQGVAIIHTLQDNSTIDLQAIALPNNLCESKQQISNCDVLPPASPISASYKPFQSILPLTASPAQGANNPIAVVSPIMRYPVQGYSPQGFPQIPFGFMNGNVQPPPPPGPPPQQPSKKGRKK